MKLQNVGLHIALLTIMLSGPLGGAWHAPVIFGLMLMSLLALSIHCLYKIQSQHPLQTNRLITLPILSVFFTLSMIIPLPTSFHAVLSPDSSADLQIAYDLLGTSPKTLFLSLAPHQTALRFMQLLTALALFLVISDQAKHRQAQKIIKVWILAGAIAFMLISLIYQPLANGNHVARIFGIFSLLCAAFYPKYLFCFVSILSGVFVYTTQSRWGMISFTLCLLFFLKSWRLSFAILSLALVTASGFIWDRLLTLLDPETYWVKIDLLTFVPDLLKRHWISGIGPGALSIEFHKNILPDFHANPLLGYHYLITHLENTTLQVLVDHGLLKGMVLWAIAIWTFMVVAKTRPRLAPVFLFVWIGDFSDFAFESGTVLYLCTLTLALCPIDFKLKLSPQKCLFVLATLGSFVFFIQDPVNYLDPEYAYAKAMTDQKNREAWLSYTLRRRPTFYQAHVSLARLYWNRQQYHQALLEYREAIASHPSSVETILEEVKPWMERALAEKNIDEAMFALELLTLGPAPTGQAAVWFEQILRLQDCLKRATIC